VAGAADGTAGTLRPVAVLLCTHERYLEHDPGRGHPERPARLTAVLDGIAAADLAEAITPCAPEAASRADLERVHDPALLDRLERLSSAGGGVLDADTAISAGSWDAALLAAGAGITAIERMDAGEADAAFCAVRPPGHHATPDRAMGFCLVNNVAVAAAHLADRGERVAVIDIDAHHGNGTQDAFWSDARVLYASLHQWPLYPGTGGLREVGAGAGLGSTLNVPLPPGATGDVYRAALEQVVLPVAEAFEPTWLLISAGFDAHRADPLTDLALSAGDVADLVTDLLVLAPAGRRLAFLEGGYDLAALGTSAAACVAALAGTRLHAEAPTSGGAGREVPRAVELVRAELLW
jgi:acetoin utilization deacetylase AcuC-like enzyme